MLDWRPYNQGDLSGQDFDIAASEGFRRHEPCDSIELGLTAKPNEDNYERLTG